MAKIFCFGNEFIQEDSLAKELVDEIDEFKIIRCSSPDSLISHENLDDMIIIDVAKGIDKPMLITDIDQLRANKSISAHDLDLGFYLKLYKKMGKIKTVKIIGIPQQGDKEALKEQVVCLLKDNI